jgi:signal transduction histidine kinase/HD-like signal output (HDOD) protein
MGTDNNKILRRLALSPLPSAPDVLLRLLGLLAKDDITFDEIAQTVRHDSALCAKVLDIAYPAYSHTPRRLLSLEQALADVGLDALKTLVFCTAVNQIFHQPAKAAENLLSQDSPLWIARAYFARTLAEQVGHVNKDEAYLAGLFYDLGKFALAANFPTGDEALLTDETATSSAESTVISHEDLARNAGVVLTSRWPVASFITDAIRYRDEPTDRITGAPTLIKVAHLANLIAEGAEYTTSLPYSAAEKLFGLQPSELEAIVENAQRATAAAVRSLSLVKDRSNLDAGAFEKVKRVRLAREVREIGLLSRMRPNFSGLKDEVDIYSAIRKTLHVLFDFAFPIFLRYDSKANSLTGVALPGQTDVVNQLNIPFVAGTSIVVDAVLRNELLHTFDTERAPQHLVVDDQLTRLTGQEGILCLPLNGRNSIIGVIALGMAEDQLARLEPQIKLLATLVTQAGLALDSARRRLPAPASIDQEPLSVSLGELRRIIHEVNNPLTIMKNYTKILRLKLPEQDPAQRDLGVIDDEIDRVSVILKTLVEPEASKTQFRPELVDINALIFDLTRLTDQALLTHQVRLHTELSHAIAPVVADRDRLKQILMNLVKNAAEAMPQGGRITIGTRDDVNYQGKPSVEITVQDFGPGIPESVKARLFQPGVTTKHGDHVGLGLSIVQGLVREIRGDIECISSPETGTTFRILLPKTRQ